MIHTTNNNKKTTTKKRKPRVAGWGETFFLRARERANEEGAMDDRSRLRARKRQIVEAELRAGARDVARRRRYNRALRALRGGDGDGSPKPYVLQHTLKHPVGQKGDLVRVRISDDGRKLFTSTDDVEPIRYIQVSPGFYNRVPPSRVPYRVSEWTLWDDDQSRPRARIAEPDGRWWAGRVRKEYGNIDWKDDETDDRRSGDQPILWDDISRDFRTQVETDVEVYQTHSGELRRGDSRLFIIHDGVRGDAVKLKSMNDDDKIHKKWVNLALSADGSTLVTARYSDVTVWRVDKEKRTVVKVQTLDNSKGPETDSIKGGPYVAISASGEVVAYARGRQVFVWYDQDQDPSALARDTIHNFNRVPGMGEWYGVPSMIADFAHGERATERAKALEKSHRDKKEKEMEKQERQAAPSASKRAAAADSGAEGSQAKRARTDATP